MMKLLILGSAGMLGHVVFTYLKEKEKYEILDASFPKIFHPDSILLDACNKKKLEKTIEKFKPEVLINCIGILTKDSQQNRENAIYLNSYLPHQLVTLQRKHGGKLIHISTDCVFSGSKGYYIETDFKDARDIYGLSKALGEVDNDIDLTFRTSIIGPELKENGEGLFHWFMSQKGTIKGYTNAFWSGVTTLELAKAIDKAIDQNLSGLYHLTAGYRISKFNLLSLFKEVWNRTDIELEPFEVKMVDKSLKNVRKDFDFSVSSYEKMLPELYEWMTKHKVLYNNYFS